jgi:diguanylate cyclase (GGDEF)-like protein
MESVPAPDASATLSSLLATTGDLLVHLNAAGVITSMEGEPLFADMCEALTGQGLTALVAEEHAGAVRQLLAQAGGAPGVSAKVRLSQMSRFAWAELRLLRHAAPSSGFMAVLRDISTVVEATQKARHSATIDVLTGRPNRLVMVAQVRAAIARGKPFSLVVLDTIDFKKVNTLGGLSAGDALLREIGHRLAKAVPKGDIVGRINGDEFAVLAASAPTPEAAIKLGHRLLSVLHSPFDYKGQTIHLGARTGAATFPTHGTTPESLIECATLALHQARAEGASSNVLYSPEASQGLSHDLELESAMYLAIQVGEFHLDYQPLYDAKTLKVQGFEALMRWTRGNGERVSPAQFVPMAERNGLITLLGAWALKAACADLLHLEKVLGYPAYMSVNVSPVQFKSDKLHENVKAALALTEVEGSKLLLEITEGTLMSEPEKSEEILKRLVGQGVRVAIDDFGTGYSSLAYLKKFPVSTLKVDRAFIKDLPGSSTDEAICRAVAGLASSLNLTTVAEGVETAEQLACLTELGFDVIQGFYTGRPASRLQLCQTLGAK